MAEKVLKKIFDRTSDIIPEGFLKLDKKPSKTTFENILEEYRTSLILVDTEGRFIKDAIVRVNARGNDDNLLVVGLVNNETLLKIKQDGIKNGFYRSTKEKINVGLIIVNKNKVFAALDIDNIFPIADSQSSKEIFENINQIIWSKTEKEYFGTLKDVKDIRLSVIAPELSRAIEPEYDGKYDYSSEGLMLNSKVVILKKPSNSKFNEMVVLENVSTNMFGNLTDMNFEVFPDKYYPFNFGNNHFDYESFVERSVESLVGKEIVVNNKKYVVSKRESIEDNDSVYLDEFENYLPAFENVAKQFSGYTNELEVSVNVKAKRVDSSYRLSKRYEIIQNVSKQIENGLATMEKLLSKNDGSLKRIDSIRKERNIAIRLKMFNDFVGDKEFGVASIRDKKSPVSIISNVNGSDLVVPNDLIGTLYSLNNNLYLATSLERITEAKKWLNENKVEARLIEK